jgi:WD40 repeat protein
MEQLKLIRKGPVLSLAYSTTLQLLAVGQMGDSVKKPSLSLWDLSNKKSILTLEDEPYSNVSAMCFDFSGRQLIYSCNDSLFILDINSREKQAIEGAPKKVNKIVSSLQKPRIVVSGVQTTVYDIESAQTIWRLEGYDASAMTENLAVPALPSEWKIKSGSLNFKNEPAIVQIFSDGQKILVGGHNKAKVEMIEVPTGKVLKEIFPAPVQAYWMSLGCDEEVLAVSSKIPYANFIWDLESGSRILPNLFNERYGGYSSLCLHPTKKWLASGTLVGFVSLQSLEDGRFILSEQLHAGRASQVIFCGNSNTIVSGGEDGTVHLIKAE